MAGASFQQGFRKQIGKAKVEIESNISRLIQNIYLLRNELMGEIQALENEEVQREEELTRLKHVLSDTAGRSNMKIQVTDIYDQIQDLLPENNSRLIVIDWNLSTEQTFLNNFCKISVKAQPSEQRRTRSPEDTFTRSLCQLNIRENDPLRSISDFYPKFPVLRSSSFEEEQTALTLEQKYKQLSDPTYKSCSKSYTLRSLQGPRGISIHDPTDQVYIADYDNHCIRVFERDGRYIREFTHNRLAHPVGIYVSSSLDRVYITLSGRQAVHCYKLEGTFIKEITNYGTNGLRFGNPIGITMDDDDRAYVCDQGRDCVGVFTKNLVFISLFTSQLSDPRDVRVLGSEVAVLHGGEYCVSYFNKRGVFLRRVVKRETTNKRLVIHLSSALTQITTY